MAKYTIENAMNNGRTELTKDEFATFVRIWAKVKGEDVTIKGTFNSDSEAIDYTFRGYF